MITNQVAKEYQAKESQLSSISQRYMNDLNILNGAPNIEIEEINAIEVAHPKS